MDRSSASRGYRIQQHALTGHWRLLDSKNVCRAWGSRAHCETTLEKLHPPTNETDSAKRVVILLHGLMRSRASMKSMESALLDPSRYQIVRFSTRACADRLRITRTGASRCDGRDAGRDGVQFRRT